MTSCVILSCKCRARAGKHAAMDYGQDVAVLGEVDGLTGGQPVSDGQHLLKFEIQLYKVRDNEYVVDFQVRAITTTIILFAARIHLAAACVIAVVGVHPCIWRQSTVQGQHWLLAAAARRLRHTDDAVLSMQRLQGELFLFLDMCSGLL